MSIYRDGEPAKREANRTRDAKRRLLGVVWPASACPSSWQTMPGDERRRRCARCQKRVYDVAPMSPSEVNDLADGIDADGSDAQVRFYRRTDGRFMVGDCPEGRARERRRARNGIFGIAVGFALTAAACSVGFGGSSSSADESTYRSSSAAVRQGENP